MNNKDNTQVYQEKKGSEGYRFACFRLHIFKNSINCPFWDRVNCWCQGKKDLNSLTVASCSCNLYRLLTILWCREKPPIHNGWSQIVLLWNCCHSLHILNRIIQLVSRKDLNRAYKKNFVQKQTFDFIASSRKTMVRSIWKEIYANSRVTRLVALKHIQYEKSPIFVKDH